MTQSPPCCTAGRTAAAAACSRWDLRCAWKPSKLEKRWSHWLQGKSPLEPVESPPAVAAPNRWRFGRGDLHVGGGGAQVGHLGLPLVVGQRDVLVVLLDVLGELEERAEDGGVGAVRAGVDLDRDNSSLLSFRLLYGDIYLLFLREKEKRGNIKERRTEERKEANRSTV